MGLPHLTVEVEAVKGERKRRKRNPVKSITFPEQDSPLCPALAVDCNEILLLVLLLILLLVITIVIIIIFYYYQFYYYYYNYYD